MLPMIPLTIHTSSIDLNYCSSARLSGDKDKVGMMGLEPTAYALEGHCSFHLRYIPVIGTRFELALPP